MCVCVCVCVRVCVLMYPSSNSCHVVIFTNNHGKSMNSFIPAAMAYITLA